MKRLPYIVIFLLIGYILHLRQVRPDRSPPTGEGAPLSVSASSGGTPKAEAHGSGEQATAFADARGLRDLLFAQGLSARVARAAVARWMEERRNQWSRQLLAAHQAAGGVRKWWLATPEDDPDYRVQAKQLANRVRADEEELAALFPGLSDNEEPDVAARFVESPTFDFLTPERRAQLGDVEEDYNQMIKKAQEAFTEFWLPSDQEKINFLEAEKKRDIEALLTPQERAELELRVSPVADSVLPIASVLGVSEEQYRALYALEKERADPTVAPPMDSDLEEVAYQERLASIVGLDQLRLFQRRYEDDYIALERASRRFGLQPKVVEAVYNERFDLGKRSAKIMSDPSLSLAQRRAAQAELARETREKVRSAFGNQQEGAEAYLNQSMVWLSALENGEWAEVRPNGTLITRPLAPSADPAGSSGGSSDSGESR